MSSTLFFSYQLIEKSGCLFIKLSIHYLLLKGKTTINKGCPRYGTQLCYILTLDRAVNQRFSAEDASAKISGSSHVVQWICEGFIKWEMQMPTWDMNSGSRSLAFQLAARRERSVTGVPTSGWPPRWGSVPQRASSWVTPPAEKQKKWVLEDNTTLYGQEKLWVSMAAYLRLLDSVSLTEALTPRRIKKSNHSRGWPESSLFDSYHTKVYRRALLHCSTLPLIRTLSYLPTPTLEQDMTQGQFLSGV